MERNLMRPVIITWKVLKWGGGVSGPILAWQEENDEKPLPTPIENSSQILTIHQMKIKDGVIYYKIKCKGRFKPLSNAKAIITPQFQVDPIKLQELLF